jgi:hypothetical protein
MMQHFAEDFLAPTSRPGFVPSKRSAVSFWREARGKASRQVRHNDLDQQEWAEADTCRTGLVRAVAKEPFLAAAEAGDADGGLRVSDGFAYVSLQAQQAPRGV